MLANYGFRRVSNEIFYIKVIRSSIDRPNITYILKKILKSQLSNYDPLYFIIYGATTQFTLFQAIKDAEGDNVPKNGKATPHLIKKTIIFIDRRKQVQTAVNQARAQLVQSTKDNPNLNKQYIYGLGSIDVYRIVQIYISTIAKYD